MKKNHVKSGFYKKYKEDNKKDKSNNDEKVIVINQEGKETTLATIFRGIGSVFRVIVYILLFILSSIGATAVINEATRISLLELINQIK